MPAETFYCSHEHDRGYFTLTRYINYLLIYLLLTYKSKLSAKIDA